MVDVVGPGVDPSWVGQRCVAENVLADGGEVGFERPGGYGEYLITEASGLQALPAEFPAVQGALIEPLAVSVRAVRRLHAQGASALILGDGPIGLLILALLHQRGLDSMALVGGRSGRLALGRRWGATEVWNYHALGDIAEGLAPRYPQGFPNVVEASGSARALSAALSMVQREGRLLVVGDYDEARARFEWNELLHRELEVIGSCASSGAWPEAVRLATSGAIPLGELISHQIKVDRYVEAMSLARGHDSEVRKVVLVW
jgi:L-iditol 2-dehydrogenase